MYSKTLFSCVAVALAALPLAAAEPDKDPPLNVKPDVIKKIEAALPEKAPAKPKQARKILIFSKTNGFRHGSIPVGVTALRMMGEKTGAFTVVHTENDAWFEPENLKGFDAVIMLNTTGQIFLPKDMPKDENGKKAAKAREDMLKESLESFVKGGKGLAGTHSATDTYQNWGAYTMMMGGAFVGHPWHQSVPLKNLDSKHPLNEAFAGDGFKVEDEIYVFRDDSALPKDRHMLLSLDGDKMDLGKGKRKDNFYPISWAGKYGSGRTFYCSLGHRDEIYYNPVVLKHYLAGFQYVLGDLDADGSPSSQSGK